MALTTQYLNIEEIQRLLSPRELKRLLPMSEQATRTVVSGRESIKKILRREDARFLVVVGPCSVHDPEEAIVYAQKLRRVQKATADQLLILMRVYFEKPRTRVGWKGLINDPRLDGSCDLETGLKRARQLLREITGIGIPVATEFLDPIVPQYLADLVSWAAIGARTTESQTHREMASGLSMPVGFKNGTDGGLQIAVDALHAARHPHIFLGIDQDGYTSIVRAKGNSWGHIVLRGGRTHTNYSSQNIRATAKLLEAASLPSVIMVDCSHANSERNPDRQAVVWRCLIDQKRRGNQSLIGAMLESYLLPGNQPFPIPGRALEYGVSITDPCLGWEATERLLSSASRALARPRPTVVSRSQRTRPKAAKRVVRALAR